MWVWYDIDKIKAREIEILDASLHLFSSHPSLSAYLRKDE